MADRKLELLQNHGVRVAAISLAALALVVCLKIAWVTDDAYISFRSVEQVIEGNGPRWNPQERVQVYTSPLWFWMLVIVRTVSANVFVNAIVLSVLLFLATLFALRRGLGADLPWSVCVTLLVASNGFFDYTTSGLENALGYLLIAMYLDAYRWATNEEARPQRRAHALSLLTVVFGLQLVCRHDMFLLTVVPTAYALWSARSLLKRRARLRLICTALAPLVLWTLFSLVYYGAPLPNTAYAKLAAGLPQSTMLGWGWQYLGDALRHDSITMIGLVAGTGVLLMFAPTRGRAIAIGILLSLAYIVWVGGDFMRGRFLSFPYLMAVAGAAMFVLTPVTRRRAMAATVVATAALLYAIVYPHTPLNSPLDHRVEIERPQGPLDERGYYWQASLYQYTRRSGDVFPAHQWALAGNTWGQGMNPFVERGVIGYFGYWAGVEKTIVDHFGLADPLLARLPADPKTTYRVGHFRRQLPSGYRDIMMGGSGRLIDPGLNSYYEKLCMATRHEPLLSAERIRTVVALNLGRYDHYLSGVQPQP